MKILALDTSATACSVALQVDTTIIALHEIAPLQQAQTILGAIDKILSQGNIALKQLDTIAFGCGPGSFTGIRIATSVAQGLGYALTLPVIPISSLAGLAQAAYERLQWRKLLVCVDARIQEVYAGAYQVNANGLVELVGQEQVCSPESLVFNAGDDGYGVGNGWEIYQQQIVIKPREIAAECLPMATGILALARQKFQQCGGLKASDVLPTYLRNEVAQKS